MHKNLNLAMFVNYLVVSVRNLARQKGYSAITISGLAVGMACCLLIFLYVQNELSYDRHHEGVDQIYRVISQSRQPSGRLEYATTPRSLVDALVATSPEILAAARLSKERADQISVVYEDKRFLEKHVLFADPSIFQTLTIPLLLGDPKTALKPPFSIVITETMAQKYFGREDPIGKTLRLRMRADRDVFEYQVTGVVQKASYHSHIPFDFLATYFMHPLTTREGRERQSWLGQNVYTYVRLQKGVLPEVLESRFQDLIKKHVDPRMAERHNMPVQDYLASGYGFGYALQPISQVHLYSHLEGELKPNGDIKYIVLLLGISAFVLCIACINFINLTTARSANRLREIGVRKVLGSFRIQLIQQFLMESVLLSLFALMLALCLVEVLLPAFNALSARQLSLDFTASWFFLPGVVGFAVVIGVVAGGYPAFYLSAFAPGIVLTGSAHTGGLNGQLRNGLVVFQFAVSIALMVSTAVVYVQMDYMLGQKLEAGKDQVVLLEGTEVLGRDINAFKQELLKHLDVSNAAFCESVPGRNIETSTFRIEGDPENRFIVLARIYAGFDFVETLGMTCVAGRTLSVDFAGDSTGVMINETAAKQLGLENPIGKRLIRRNNDLVYTIVGVLKDYHFESSHSEIMPAGIFGPDPYYNNRPRQLMAVRIKSEHIASTLARLEMVWDSFAPGHPFAYGFMDADFEALYQAERTVGRLLGGFSILAVVIACLGLFGLAAFTSEKRKKEIGVRKVMGASISNIVFLLSRDYVKLMLIANVIAWPSVYFVMRMWLQNFAYRIELGIGVFLVCGISALLLAVLTVSYQAIKAASANPIDALRYE